MADAHELLRRQRVLADFGDFVLDHEHLDAILHEGCRLIAQALDAPLAMVIEIQREGGTCVIRAGVGWRPGIVGRERIPLSARSSEVYAIAQTEPVITNDIAQEERFVFAPFLREHGVVALVNLPILLPGRTPWGLLQVDARQRRDFDQADIEFLKTYAMVLGPVIDRLGIAADREEARRELSEREERLRRVLGGMGEAFGLLAPDFTILEQNSEALRLDGRSREEVVGRSHWDVYPGSEHSDVGRLLKRAMADRTSVTLEHRYAWNQGVARWLEMRAHPTADGALAVFWRDVTERREAADALRAGEQRYRSLFESMDEAYAVVDVLKDDAGRWADFRFVEVNPAFVEHTSMPWPVGKTATELLGTPNPRWTQLYGRALDTGRPIRVEEGEPTVGRVFDLNIFTLDRERDRVAVLFTDVTQRRKTDRALRESEARLREREADLARVQRIGGVGGLDIDVADGMSSRRSPEYLRLHGLPPETEGETHADWRARVHPDDVDEAESRLFSALDGEGHAYEGEYRIVRPSDGAVRWIAARTDIERDAEGRAVRMVGAHIDVTEQRRAQEALRENEERLTLLVAELQHRTRNLLAVVGGVADQTRATSATMDEFGERLDQRLAALGRVQGLLSTGPLPSISLHELLALELEAHGLDACADPALSLSGPPVPLPAEAVQPLALALHELTTNALKHGALGRGGRLEIAWSLEQEGEAPRLVLDWRERGVAMPGGEPRRGFGRDLIEVELPYELDARTRLEFGPDGVSCRIDAPLRPSG